MMATSMGPNFTGGHPAGMTHPGVANHGMGPGMSHNPGQQGVPGGGMPHQFAGGAMAIQAPGGQVNPAMMGGMPQGANPHAHGGMQHLNPQQQQQLLQQQQQFQNCMFQPQSHPLVASVGQTGRHDYLQASYVRPLSFPSLATC